MLLWGIDELLTYHYLVAEVYRVVPPSKLPYEQFWKMSKRQQADHIWKHLFIERAPISEACRGILTAIKNLGLDPNESPEQWRKWFDAQDPSDYIDKVMQVANVKSITMTNPVFDDNERERWLKNPNVGNDPRFKAVLRIDPLLRDWPTAAKKITAWGYPAERAGQFQIDRVGEEIPARLDRQTEGDLPRGQSAAGLDVPGKSIRSESRRWREDSRECRIAGLRRARLALRDDDRQQASRESGAR